MDRKPIHELPPGRLVIVECKGPDGPPRPMSPKKREETRKYLEELDAWRQAHPGQEEPPPVVYISEQRGP